MKVTYRFLLDDPANAQERRFVREAEWPSSMPLPYAGVYLAPAETLNPRPVSRVIFFPDAEQIMVEFRVDGLHDSEPQAGALMKSGFREIEPTPPGTP